jgi:sugar phosphate isomerase/epimerase
MEINYCCTHWGSEHMPPLAFLDNLLHAGYSGLEINLSPGNFEGADFFNSLQTLREESTFSFIAQQVLDNRDETPREYMRRMVDRLEYIMEFSPDFINSHTGKDYYDFDDNCRIIDAAENVAAKYGIPILHETHRGRFTFHLSTLMPYLKKFPLLELTGDFSHWCNVSESMLQDQQHLLQEIIPNVAHIHARVGSDQTAQVNNPFAPEWNEHLAVFLDWWKAIIAYRSQKSSRVFTVTPEFGPAPYMPELPFSRTPVANQWEINVEMKNYLQMKLDKALWATTEV